jgi:WD40 repeat protein
VKFLSDHLLITASDDNIINVKDVNQVSTNTLFYYFYFILTFFFVLLKDKTLFSFNLPNNSIPYTMAINRQNHIFSIGDLDGFVTSYHINQKGILQHFEAHAKAVVTLQYSLDGEDLMTSGQEGIVRQWIPYEKAICHRSILPSSQGY